MTLDKKTHILLYFSDLWHYILNNLKNNNVQEFSQFLLFSRRISVSIIFEFHAFPFGLAKAGNEIFSFFLNNSTLIVLTKSLSDENRLNMFKRRFLQSHLRNFEKAQTLSKIIASNSENKGEKAYIVLQKDINQAHRLIRLDMFGLNIINILK